MASPRNRRWLLAHHPRGVPRAADFVLDEGPLPRPGEGELLIHNTLISVDAGVLTRLSRDSYRPKAQTGEVVDGFCVGVVEESNNPRFSVGDKVTSGFGWQEYYVSDGKGLLVMDPELFRPPVTEGAAIGVLGVSGMTAYFGLLRLGEPKAGETVLVSSAAGTVGGTAGQIARIKGCRVVGIAGGSNHNSYVTGELGLDACIDYKAVGDLSAAVADACPGGVDVYVDTVGGPVLDAALVNMNRHGRIAMVGQLSEYTLDKPRGAHHVLEFVERRLRMEGMVVWDFLSDFKQARNDVAGWIRTGDLVYREQVFEGFGSLPEVFVGLFTGASTGRCLVRV